MIIIKDIIISAIILGVISTAIRVIAPYSKKFVTWLINRLVNKAEKKIAGSKMGAAKKAWVEKHLKLFGVSITEAVCSTIDISVDVMNSKRNALQSSIEENVAEQISDNIDNAITKTKNKLSK